MNLESPLYRTITKRRTAVLGLSLLIFTLFSVGTVSAQLGGATVYSSASTISVPEGYGSLGHGIGFGTSTSTAGVGNPALNFQSGSSLSATNPYYTTSPLIAQATPAPVPAPVSPISPVSPGSTTAAPPAVSVSSPLFMQPLDPYATPNQSSLFPASSGTAVLGTSGYQTGYNSSPSQIYSGNFDRFFPETYDAMRRFREATSFEYTFLPGGNKSDSFGLGEIDLRMQLAFPCRFIPNNGTGRTGSGYFYVAPGGSLVWWDGPVGPPDMSPNGFGAFLDFGMQPQFNDVFALDAWFRFGVFSDFKNVKSDALRYQGRLMGLFTVTPQLKIVGGVIYMDRERVKMLPTGGVVWTPRDDLILRLTFPNPKISKRLWNSGRAEWWGYINADYGGGSWDISGLGKTDYNDVRVGVGLEFETYSRVNGYFEFGGSFNRELYSQGTKWSSPPDVIYLKTGFIF